MPKNKEKGKRREVTATSDDDFDDMLAELRAADLTALAADTSGSSSSSSGIATTASSITSKVAASTVSSTAKAMEVPEEKIIEAVRRDDIAQLLRWARQGLRVASGLPLVHAMVLGKLGIAQCLVQELGADFNEADREGYTPLYIAAQKGELAMVRCLVQDFGADVNKANQTGATPLYIAAQEGKRAMVQCLVKELGADVNQSTFEGNTFGNRRFPGPPRIGAVPGFEASCRRGST
jgi:hypothetical protein